MQKSYLTTTRNNKTYYNKPPPQSHTTPTTNSSNSKPPLLPPPPNFLKLNTTNTTQTATKTLPFHNNPTNRPFQPRTRRLSDEEINEKRAKNLCFWCDDKFTPGHQCKKKQLHMIVVQELPEEDLELMQDNFSWPRDDPTTMTTPNISLNAMGGVEDRAHQTMRIMGKYKKKLLHILVDSGSTHNFLDLTVVKGLGYPLQAIDPVSISVANGQEMWCHHMCKQFTWEVQG